MKAKEMSMLRRITLKLVLLVGLCVMAFGSQPGVAGCGEECRAADDGWMVCAEGSYRSYCEITSRCDECVPDSSGVCIPECTNLCGTGMC